MITILKKLRCCCTSLYRADAVRYGMMMALVVGLLFAVQPTLAQSDGNACIKEATGLNNPSCTANDVRIGSFRVIAGPTTCDPDSNDTIQVTVEATIESGPARYDIGIWINEAGGSARSDTTGDNCYRDFLSPVAGTINTCEPDGPYYNADNDGCGDVHAVGTNPCGNAVVGPCTDGGGGTCLFTTKIFTVNILCRDSNSDGTADVGSCTSWEQNSAPVCGDELDTNPGTGSKCNCGTTNIIGLHTGCVANSDCDDQNECTTDTCSVTGNVGTCVNENISCDDNNECTTDSCDPATGCVNATISCDDGNVCDGTETCDPVNGCQEGTPLSCDDGNVCDGTETCDPVNGCQEGTPLSCDDGNVCDGTETCDPVNGCQEGTPLVCGDGNVCDGIETCDPVAGCQEGTPLVCGDGNVCDGIETCDPVAGCQEGTPLVCGDGNVCDGIETCDPVAGCQEGTPLSCGDGNACDGIETCDPVAGCQEGTPVNCDDGNSCTADSCDPATGACSNVGQCPSDTQLAPTATTCSDFRDGTAADLEELLYGLKGGAINSVSPGVLFLYDGVSVTTNNSTITVTQSDGPWEPQFLGVHQGQIVLYNALSCSRVNFGTVTVSSTGDVTITGVPIGEYILGIKYDPTTLKGFAPGGNPSATFTFAVFVNAGSSGSDSVDVNPKP